MLDTSMNRARHEKHKRLEMMRWLKKLDSWMPDQAKDECLEISKLRQSVFQYKIFLDHK